MDLNIAIPQIDPFENSHTFIFRPGISLITGLNGSGKSIIAREILKQILIQKNYVTKYKFGFNRAIF
jgi:adenylylsulfate kinase-like enzyme